MGILCALLWFTGLVRAERFCEGPQNVGDRNAYQVEMAISVDPNNSDRQVIAVTRPGDPVSNIRTLATLDGGRTWHERTLLPPALTGYDTKRPYSDPTVVHDSNGDVHVAFLLDPRCGTDTDPCDDWLERAIIRSKSTDGGLTFVPYVQEPLRRSNASAALDKPWLLADNDPGSPGYGNLYAAYTLVGSDATSWIRRSTDGGDTWTLPVQFTASSFFVGLDSGPNGEVYAIWFTFGGGDRKITFGNLGVEAADPSTISTFEIANVNDEFPTTIDASPTRAVYPVPSIGVDRSNGPNRGRIWVAYTHYPSPGMANQMDLYVRWSDDGGSTWPNAINLGESVSAQFLPWLSVDPRDGSVGIVYYSTEPSGGDATNVFYRTYWDGSPNNPAHWIKRQLSSQPSDTSDGNGNDYREYIGLQERRNVAHAAWTSRHGPPAPSSGQVQYARVPGPITQALSDGNDEVGDQYGKSLAAADFNGDGYDDLAVAAPLEDDVVVDEGKVTIHYGSPDGLIPPLWERVNQSMAGAAREAGDAFGSALAAGDFNGDGFADLAAGVPGEDAAAVDEGAVVVFDGSANGLVPVNALVLDQSDLGQDQGTGDRFGESLAAGDFNGDGYDDLAIGLPTEDDLAFEDGIVSVVFGSPLGLDPANVERLRQNQDGSTAADSDRFGEALEAGDFNGDGRDDLAVGIPSRDDQNPDSGNVLVYFGSVQGLLPASPERLSQTDAGRPSETGDRFGASLSAADFDGDGRDDLAVGVPDEFQNQPEDGAVIVFYGSTAGLLPASTELLLQTRGGEVMEAGDRFGRALASGDLNGDAFDDLIAAIPQEDGTAVDEGALIVFYGSISGLLPANGPTLVRSLDLGGAAEAGDEFGSTLALGDFNGDCHDDLAVSVPLEDLPQASDSGAVLLEYGGVDGVLADPVERVTGDVDCNGCVDHHDRQTVLQGQGGPNVCGSDVNGDRVVDSFDLSAQQPSCGVAPCNGCMDADCDGYAAPGSSNCPLGAATDCADGAPDVQFLPGEARDLRIEPVGANWQLQWNAPESLGGEPDSVGYDVLRARAADLFGVCVESDDGSDTVALDPGIPSLGEVYYYLVRAVNVCGDGSLGQESSSSERGASACP